MLVACIACSTLFVLAANAHSECGPNVFPMYIIPTKPCKLRLSRDDLNATDSDLVSTLERAFKKAEELSVELKVHEEMVTRNVSVRMYTPEYHHYLTNTPNENDIQEVKNTTEDHANCTSIARQLVADYGIPSQYAGDVLISLKIPAKPSHVFKQPSCNASEIYRRIDGACNNLYFPSWGMTDTVFVRLLTPKYDDGIYQPRKSVTGKELPNPRVLRRYLNPVGEFDDDSNTLLVMQFGQLTAHDMALSADQVGRDGLGIECCARDGGPLPADLLSRGCYPVKIPDDDPYYSKRNVTCISVVRSMKRFTVGGNLGPAETINSNNHILDASPIYGNSESGARSLREFVGGRLRVQVLPDGRHVLPQADNPIESCSLRTNTTCFVGGDVRVNQNTQLTVLQILFLREHNRAAKELAAMNPHWDDEKVYRETQRYIIALYQHIVYWEYLPQIIDERLLKKYHVAVNKTGFSNCYNWTINPSTMTEFTESIYRLFHGIAQSNLVLYKDIGCPVSKIKLGKWMDNPKVIVEGENMDQLVRGLTQQPATRDDRYATYELSNNMFRASGCTGQDLDMFDYVRSRDNGLGTYNDYREIMSHKRAKKFEDFSDLMPYKDAIALSHIYEHPDDVDPMAILLETRNAGKFTVSEGIMVEQFYRWKCGDRFFYDYNNSPYPFTEEQINTIKKASMSRIICDNSDNITRIQPNSFKLVSETNKPTDCKNIPVVDLSYWKEDTEQQS